MSIIQIEQVDLLFHTKRERRLKELMISSQGRFSTFTKDGTVEALKDFTLTVREGERLAVIGHNGAGKSTMLRLINGIYPPSSGRVLVEGRISGLFEFATGFEMELSGWDNIYLRGLMLGETPQSIRKKMREIAEFSELGDFLNMPVKYYSSGMFVRLAFSVSTAIEPDILLLDEAIGAGDAGFIEKANCRMQDMVQASKIMVLVTHSMSSAIMMCNRCIWLEQGRVVMDGSPEEVTKKYLASM